MGRRQSDSWRSAHLLSLVRRQSRRSISSGPRIRSHQVVATRGDRLLRRRRSPSACPPAATKRTKQWWPADFRLVYRATFGSELHLELEVDNTGDAGLRFEEALHAYFEVGDVRMACVNGLDESTISTRLTISRKDAARRRQNLIGDRSRLPRHANSRGIVGSGSSTASRNCQRELADDCDLEPVDGKGNRDVRPRRRRLDTNALYRNQQRARLRRRSRPRPATPNESSDHSWLGVETQPERWKRKQLGGNGGETGIRTS